MKRKKIITIILGGHLRSCGLGELVTKFLDDAVVQHQHPEAAALNGWDEP